MNIKFRNFLPDAALKAELPRQVRLDVLSKSRTLSGNVRSCFTYYRHSEVFLVQYSCRPRLFGKTAVSNVSVARL